MIERLTDEELKSAEEWLNHWGDGPNWSDATGATVPTTKTMLRALIAELRDRRAAEAAKKEGTP